MNTHGREYCIVKHYNDAKCAYKDNYKCNCCNFVFINGHTYCQKYTKE